MNELRIRITRDGESAAPADRIERAEGGPTAEETFLGHFGLNEQPFGVTPDPRFLYLGPKHRQALAALNYGTESNRGFLTLIARPGMGKTSLIFQYLEGLREKARTVFLFQTTGDAHDLMRYVLTDLGQECAGKDLPEMHAILNQILMEEIGRGRTLVVVIDEAQNLEDKVLESVRLLSNFETPGMKLMQIVLAGQPQLAERLAKPSMAQLRQRVSLSIRIEPFTSEEVNAYVDHRLSVAGYTGPSLFTAGARAMLLEFSEGIPRVINNMCFCAMSLCWATKRKTIDREMMRDILADLNLAASGGETVGELKSAEELKPPAPPAGPLPVYSRRAVLTLQESPSRPWLRNIAGAGIAFFVLGWAGFNSDFDKWLRFFPQTITAVERGFALPTSTDVSADPALPPISKGSLLNATSEAGTTATNPPAARQSDGLSPIAKRGSD